jgi:hypothetical protein
MATASSSGYYRIFQIVACLVGAGLIVFGLVRPDTQLLGFGAVILIHGLVATFMIWLDGRRLGKP